MARKADNFVPMSLSVLLHGLLLGSMLAAFSYERPAPFTPLTIQATLITEEQASAAPSQPPPKQEPPPVVEEPPPQVEEPPPEEPEEPDNSLELQRQAEEEKRVQDALIEKQRLEEIRKQEEAERLKKEREEAQRKAREEADRKKREEEEKERKRVEAEQKRLEDIERQRLENERLRKELEAEQRQEEIDTEARRLALQGSTEMQAYIFAISQKIGRNWSAPASAGPETKCVARVRQLPGGDVVGVTIQSCNGDEAVKRSIEAAIRRASPLPEPSNPDLFDPNLTLNLTLQRND